jgi:hypothetical protein
MPSTPRSSTPITPAAELTVWSTEVLSESCGPRGSSGVIFMLDHALEEQPLDERGVNAEPTAEHEAAFAEFDAVLSSNSDVKGALRALVLMANKSDLWPRQLTYGKLLQHSGVASRLKEVKEGISTYGDQTSAKYGNGIRPAVDWLARSL